MDIKLTVRTLLYRAYNCSSIKDHFSSDFKPVIGLEWTKDITHGDLASNIALVLAKAQRSNPRDLAAELVTHIPSNTVIKSVEVAGPGFINFSLQPAVLQSVVAYVAEKGEEYGLSNRFLGQRVHMEYVSANPTGPLHVGHGRGAAQGATLANLLEAVGYQVHREYYVNDAGRQMRLLALSIWLRYLVLCGETLDFPSKGYHGDYVIDIAKVLYHKKKKALSRSVSVLFEGIPADLPDSGDDHIDALISRAIELLGETDYQMILKTGLDSIESSIHTDLNQLGIRFDRWFHESELQVEASVEKLKSAGHVYEKDGAQWFRAKQFGDVKDRVLIRSDGRSTYFAADVAYHLHKYQEGYDQIIDIFGADHHGYVARIRAFLAALGCEVSKLDILIVQFATLYRGKERLSMSTRQGQYVTLRALYEEVGRDATRFFYVMRRMDQHMDFDLELAKSHSNDNPVYYIQYAHARICSVFRQLLKTEPDWNLSASLSCIGQLTEMHETRILRHLIQYPEVIEQAALNKHPHLLAYYLQQLANYFHTYYNAYQFLLEDKALRDARLCLISAVRQVFFNGLALLGVSAPESM